MRLTKNQLIVVLFCARGALASRRAPSTHGQAYPCCFYFAFPQLLLFLSLALSLCSSQKSRVPRSTKAPDLVSPAFPSVTTNTPIVFDGVGPFYYAFPRFSILYFFFFASVSFMRSIVLRVCCSLARRGKQKTTHTHGVSSRYVFSFV